VVTLSRTPRLSDTPPNWLDNTFFEQPFLAHGGRSACCLAFGKDSPTSVVKFALCLLVNGHFCAKVA
jgi:hypothetical protein